MMKNMIVKRLSAVAALFVFSMSVFAFAAGIEGKYKGLANLEGLGNIAVTAEIKGSDDKLSGNITSSQGDAQILDGSVKDGKLTLQIAVGDTAATVNGTVDDKGKITGSISGDQINGTIEMSRVEETPAN
ncbi:MAG: hypothetical protein ACR2N3_11780 [Pyrinomonadaceae bacterium]